MEVRAIERDFVTEGLTVTTEVPEGVPEGKRDPVFVTDGDNEVEGLVEGGSPIVPTKLYEHVGPSLTNEYPDVAPYE